MKNKVLKLAKRLKTFSLTELELIADTNCKAIVNELVVDGLLNVKNKGYEYVEPLDDSIKIIPFKEVIPAELMVSKAVEIFMKKYVVFNCKTWTVKTYTSIFQTNILPYFRKTMLHELDLDKILDYYEWLRNRRLSAQRTKNTMALLNQLVHYFQELGVIDRRCDFKVKRVDSPSSAMRNVI